MAGAAEVGRQLLPASKLAPHTTHLAAFLSHLAAQLGQKPTLLVAISMCSVEVCSWPYPVLRLRHDALGVLMIPTAPAIQAAID